VTKSPDQPWNRGRYWAATIALCALLVFSGLLVLRDSTTSIQISNELSVPTFIGTYILPVAQIVAAAIILWRGFPTLRAFAYAWALLYFVIELILFYNAQDYIRVAFSAFKIVVWVFAFWWDRDRIHRKVSHARPQPTV